MRGKPTLDEFRSGGAEGAVEEKAAKSIQPSANPTAVDEKQNKTIRIRKSFNLRLADEAFARSKVEGRKVNESDIIDEALGLWFARLDQS
jgi:hypothetical protein